MGIAILDIDGTLVDTNYQHAIAWFRAFARHDLILPIWRIHRHIGMGGDQVITSLCGEEVEQRLGDALRESEEEAYSELIGEVRTMDGSRELISTLKQRGHTVVLASSAKQEEVDVYLDLLDARDLTDAWTTSADVEATKPEPDLVQAALERAGGEPGEAVMIGDSPWDCKAAEAAGVTTVAVLTGGFSIEELKESGAREVYESVRECCERVDDLPLG